jgi:tRNA(Ile)-lysidine synthetase-like protein
VLSVSGGVDSVLTLYFLCYLRSFLGLKISAVHFNHGLRGEESDKDQYFCEKLCREQSVPLQVFRLSFSSQANLQNEARILRQNYLKDQQSRFPETWIVTGHHRNDCVESFLIAVHQGRWDQRLFFLPVFDEHFRFFRPLVSLDKDIILQTCQSAGYEWREDSSNQSDKYLRNFYRHGILSQKGKGVLSTISGRFADYAGQQMELFCKLFAQIVVLSPENRLWQKVLPAFPGRHPLSGFDIRKKLLQDFSLGRKEEFFYAFCEKFFIEYLSLLDMKRVRQIFSVIRKEPGTFLITREKSEKGQIVLLETSRSYAVFNFL